jgi:hypothetical protein
MSAIDLAVMRAGGFCFLDQVNRNRGPQLMVASCQSTRGEECGPYRGGRPISRPSSLEEKKVL